MTVVRRFAAVAVYGTSGAGLLGGLLFAESVFARRTVGPPATQPPFTDGRYGDGYGDGTGEALRLLVLGDSAAAGLGVESPDQTPGALLARGLAAAAKRPVQLLGAAAVGARSEDLDGQVSAALRVCPSPDLAVIVVGVNDVTHARPLRAAGLALAAAVRRLRRAGAEVVIGTCPDLGTVRPIPQPLRTLACRLSRRLAAAQTVAAVEAGARTVSLGDLLGPQFAKRPRELFGPDRFHPSAAGYAAAAAVLLPALCRAAGVAPEAVPAGPAERDQRRTEVQPTTRAAVRAAAVPGTEVAPAAPSP